MRSSIQLQAAGVEKNTTPLLIFAASAVDGDLNRSVIGVMICCRNQCAESLDWKAEALRIREMVVSKG